MCQHSWAVALIHEPSISELNMLAAGGQGVTHPHLRVRFTVGQMKLCRTLENFHNPLTIWSPSLHSHRSRWIPARFLEVWIPVINSLADDQL
jgi:hypothetical protein